VLAERVKALTNLGNWRPRLPPASSQPVTLRELPDPAQQGWIAWIGIKESLCNLDVACFFGITASLVATVGRRRVAVASAG